VRVPLGIILARFFGGSLVPSGMALPNGVNVVMLPYGVVGDTWMPVLA